MATKDDSALTEMLERYQRAADSCSELYDEAAGDIRFVSKPGCQWDEKLKMRRGNRGCYEFPKLNAHVRQIVNEMRQQRPQGKVRGVEESDTGLAEIMNGLCRNIQDVSNADQAHDIAFESAAKGGLGFWRIRADYSGEDSFEQCIYIEPVRNFAAVKFDPAAAAIDRRDALFAFVEEFIPETEFERLYPKAKLQSFDGSDAKDWHDDGKVRVAEYWYKKPITRTLFALSTGETVWEDETSEEEIQQAGKQVVKTRDVDTHKVYMRLTSGAEWLTDEQEFPSKFIPIVPVWGNIENIDGEDYWQGMVRGSKDQQRLHNVHRTAIIEAVAKAPKAPFLTKLSWIKGLEKFWDRANAEDFPYLPISETTPDGTFPKRAEQAELPAALIQLAGMDNDDIKSATGIYDPSLGSQAQETSGVAIQKRQTQSSVATFNYLDNLSYAIRFEYEILIDMIPRIYDTPRVVRIIGDDGAQAWKQLYQEVQDPQTGQTHVLNDISKGKYDITVTVGPNFATQRMEAVSAFSQLVGQIGPTFPPLAELLAYQVVKNLDLPGNEETAEAVRKILVGQGLLEPGENDQPPGPNPQQQAQQQQAQAQSQRDQADVRLKQAQAAKTMAEAQAVLPQAHAQIEKDLAQAGHQHIDDHAAMIAMQLPPAMPQVKPQPPQAGGFNTQGL